MSLCGRPVVERHRADDVETLDRARRHLIVRAEPDRQCIGNRFGQGHSAKRNRPRPEIRAFIALSARSAPNFGTGAGGSLERTMAHEFIYQAYKLTRLYPPDKTVLENISLSFYPGAKIGVLGTNGAGKSSLLKIMAGLDDGYSGEARLTPGFTVGYLAAGAATRSRQGRQGQRHGRRRRGAGRSSIGTTR